MLRGMLDTALTTHRLSWQGYSSRHTLQHACRSELGCGALYVTTTSSAAAASAGAPATRSPGSSGAQLMVQAAAPSQWGSAACGRSASQDDES